MNADKGTIDLRAAVLTAFDEHREVHGESCDCEWGITIGNLSDAALASTESEQPAGLDGAWRDAEAACEALSPHWRIEGLRLVDTSDSEDLGEVQYEWEAEASTDELFTQPRNEVGYGMTPIAALRGLAFLLGSAMMRDHLPPAPPPRTTRSRPMTADKGTTDLCSCGHVEGEHASNGTCEVDGCYCVGWEEVESDD